MSDNDVSTDPTTACREARDLLLRLRADHQRAAAEFRWPDLGPRFNWAHDWFDRIAVDNDATALTIVEQDLSAASVSFADLARRSNQVAHWLTELGVRRGDAVLVMLGNQVELWEVMLAVFKLGAVVLPTTTALGRADLADRLERAEVRAIICNPGDVEKFDGLAEQLLRICTSEADGCQAYADSRQGDESPVPHPDTAPGDRLLLYFTSGTTNRPKLVEHTQVSYPLGHLSTMYWLGLQPGDVHLNISAPGWAKHAWSNFFAPWIAEATALVFNYTRLDANTLPRLLDQHAVTSFCAPPTVWRMLIKADLGDRPRALREALAAGEPLNPEVISQVEQRWGLTVRDGFGQTETTAQVANTPGQPVRPGSMGRALPGIPSVLVDPASGELVEGAGEGELCLDLSQHPVSLMKGYVGDLERNEEALADGFYHTGDVAARDADGYITFIGRTDDVFKASDYKISPFELESVLIEHPAVAESAIVPAPDPVRLAVPKAYVQLAAGHEPTEETALSILAFARERLAPFQRIRKLEFTELPKTVSGKIRRVELRAKEEQGGNRAEFTDDSLR
ncbi:AMP-dependent synthetase [Enemella dayhoffiae]|uniref:AMP-dependent synthetase n=1 Tax=Enemella dayhoffiae TaxID=2016507 RepID=A0A255GUC0_9ACTN|nr:AMP-binding protein [Enemella dayhoffiae]OYO19299.1 AMP-dependent synthetase [Enemella dayhoffiae]